MGGRVPFLLPRSARRGTETRVLMAGKTAEVGANGVRIALRPDVTEALAGWSVSGLLGVA